MAQDTNKTPYSKLLECCVTRSEAAHMYCRQPNTVTMAILRNKLVARQTLGGGWLISVHSLKELWGKPINELPTEEV